MNPLFTLGEEFRFHDSSRFRKKAADAKFRFYHSFVPVLISLVAESCRSRAESVHLLKPYLQWGKDWKSSNFMTPDDSARNRKMRKMMSLNCSICSMPVFGVGKDIEFGLRKGGPPSKHKRCRTAVTTTSGPWPIDTVWGDPLGWKLGGALHSHLQILLWDKWRLYLAFGALLHLPISRSVGCRPSSRAEFRYLCVNGRGRPVPAGCANFHGDSWNPWAALTSTAHVATGQSPAGNTGYHVPHLPLIKTPSLHCRPRLHRLVSLQLCPS